MNAIIGGCLCGGVRYHSSEEPKMTAVCHCSHCQKQTGTAFSVLVCVSAESIHYYEQASLAEYTDSGESGAAVHRHFCNHCGSPILSLPDSMPGMAFIKAGTLDDTSWLKPTAHVWCSSAQPWVNIPTDAVQFPRGSQG